MVNDELHRVPHPPSYYADPETDPLEFEVSQVGEPARGRSQGSIILPTTR
jgi:hypothetical protein